jgi:hypothetical protein
MPVQVLIESIAENGFRATSGAPLAMTVEAPTREKALAKLKALLGKRLRNGAELVSVDLAPPAEEHPWVKFAGMYDPNDPLIKSWKRSMAEYRRKKDAEPDLP